RGLSSSPSSASSDPIITFIRVDLPAPLRPISPTRALAGSAAEALSRIVRPPRRTVRFEKFSMGGPIAADQRHIHGLRLSSFFRHSRGSGNPRKRNVFGVERTAVHGFPLSRE